MPVTPSIMSRSLARLGQATSWQLVRSISSSRSASASGAAPSDAQAKVGSRLGRAQCINGWVFRVLCLTEEMGAKTLDANVCL
eukprot:scaffold243837_cov52-Prasinocladus_malaysianus.AAC.1